MDNNIIIGIVLVICSLTVNVVLVLWARRTINRISGNGYRTARQTLKELKSGN